MLFRFKWATLREDLPGVLRFTWAACSTECGTGQRRAGLSPEADGRRWERTVVTAGRERGGQEGRALLKEDMGSLRRVLRCGCANWREESSEPTACASGRGFFLLRRVGAAGGSSVAASNLSSQSTALPPDCLCRGERTGRLLSMPCTASTLLGDHQRQLSCRRRPACVPARAFLSA